MKASAALRLLRNAARFGLGELREEKQEALDAWGQHMARGDLHQAALVEEETALADVAEREMRAALRWAVRTRRRLLRRGK